MEQQSDSWLEWRKKGLGASDAVIVMGASPWKTPYQLWCEKTSPHAPISESNWATERGNRLEPKARARYEIMSNIDMKPAVMEHVQFPFIRASLDGYNPEQQLILEIKCPGNGDHELAKAGAIPPKYMWQLQHQLLVTGAKECHYYSYYEDNEGYNASDALVVVKPEPVSQGKLLISLADFWWMVQCKIRPELTHKDAEDMTNVSDEKTRDILERLVRSKRAFDEAPRKTKAIKAEFDSAKQAAAVVLAHTRVRYRELEIAKIDDGSYRVRILEEKNETDSATEI